jgi:glutamate dehydrogenase/leucine dehydrogenase
VDLGWTERSHTVTERGVHLMTDFQAKLAGLTDSEFVKKAKRIIWLAAWANNNLRSKYHGEADACYDEAVRRGKPELYKTAYDQAVASTK